MTSCFLSFQSRLVTLLSGRRLLSCHHVTQVWNFLSRDNRGLYIGWGDSGWTEEDQGGHSHQKSETIFEQRPALLTPGH